MVAQVRVDHGEVVLWCSGFYTAEDGLIIDGVEFWTTEGSESPPEWRKEFTTV